MISRYASTLVFVLGVAVAGCGAAVAPADGGGGDGSMSDVVVRPDTCLLPNGETCAVGATCPAGDGCNTCSCMRGQMFAACTLIGCIDAGPAGCRSAEDCADGRECVFSTSSCGATGTCERPTPCAEPQVYCACSGETYRSCRPTQPTRAMGSCASVRACNSRMACPPTDECIYPVGACAVDGVCRGITDCAATAEFCSCEGATYRACPNAPTRPTRAAGACSTVPDGGVADAGAPLCAGATLDPMRRQCTNASGAALAPECCTGWNCDASSVLCDRVPPACPAGWVGSVAGSCWGPCVPAANCGR